MDDHATRRALDRRVDPVAQAGDYQVMILGLLGDGDPVAVQEAMVPEVRELVRAAGRDLLVRPAPGEWSVTELVGHLLDAEVVTAARYRWILAHDRPSLIGFDQDLWVQRLGHQEDDPEEMLSLLEALRRSNVALWVRTALAERARVGIHAERGPESFDLLFRLVAGHGLFHLAQMRQTLDQISSTR
jgi:hypothetical protein